MNELNISPEDPRLTAYALGELEGEESAQVAAAVAADPVLRVAVEEIRGTAGRLAAALAAEPLPEPMEPVHFESYHTVRPARVFRFPYWGVAALAAAACLAVILVVREIPNSHLIATRRIDEIAKAKSADKNAAETAAARPTQAHNHIDLNFQPEKSADGGQAQAVAALGADQIGVVVPNLPQPAIASMAGAPASNAPDISKTLSQSTPSPLTSPPVAGENTVRLQPFSVNASADSGYYGSDQSLFGSRTKPNGAGNLSSKQLAWGGAVSPFTAKRSDSINEAKDEAREFVRQMRGMAENRIQPPANASGNFNTEAYDYVADNDFLAATQNPLSTFSVDVDTASYSNVRRFLENGRRPPRDAVRIEELVNYFAYDYAAPRPADKDPFAASLEVAAAPWAPTHRLVRIGLKARELPTADRPAANLIFLLDVSGSMGEPNKLPLVKESMRMLVEKLKPEDRVAIVTYAGTSGLALPSTPVSHKQEILDILDSLHAGGTTNGAMGIQLAYDVAKANFIPAGVNRVILATDGDFNIGVTDRGDLVRLIQEKAKSGVFLSALGFGMGNYKDATLEQLADKGNGAYAYIDTAREARKVLAEQVNGTLATVAKDVKVQVEFNPTQVQAYRLIGYEDRLLKKEDFDNDKIDAGDVGAGHTVTALYEIVPAGVEWKPDSTVDPLKYQRPEARSQKPEVKEVTRELLTVKLRYKTPDGDTSKLLEFPLTDQGTAFAGASVDFKFAAAVAGFGMVLRDSPHKGVATLDSVLHWAESGTGSDAGGYRTEFVSLVKRAEEVLPSQG